MNKFTGTLKSVFLGIVSMVFLVCLGTTFILNFRPLYYFDIDFLDICRSSGIAREEIIENYNALIDYNSPLFTGKLEFPTLPMSDFGEYHFAEVKNIFNTVFILGIIMFVILIIFLPPTVRKIKNSLKIVGIVTFALPIVLTVLILSNFSKAFVLFHEILFDNEYWVFDIATDPIITILPEEYFMHCGIGILLFPILGGLIIFIISVIINKKIRQHN